MRSVMRSEIDERIKIWNFGLMGVGSRRWGWILGLHVFYFMFNFGLLFISK
jgi:hypothetical protein